MKIDKLHTELINTIIESQLDTWQEARTNFFALQNATRKPVSLGSLRGAVQCNPARIRSTAAAVDKKSIAERACFLCASNRPKEQATYDWIEGWELLVNPYPILPVHFTIVSKEHRPQDELPFEIAAMAEAAPDLAIFYNGARAGASAPDHAHLQAVLKGEMPLLRIAEENHPDARAGYIDSSEFGIDLPFAFISGVITPDMQGMSALAKLPGFFGIDAETGEKDKGLINAFFWIDAKGLLRCIIIPRRRHRPNCYFADGETKIMVSPGAIDMAGLIITPRREDFEKITSEDISKIYKEVAFEKLPGAIIEYIK